MYTGSSVESATPSVIGMTYNTTLANIVPAASSFVVLVNSVARVVNSVTVSGTSVKLTLSTPIVSGDVVSVAYTKPTVNPLQTATGGQAVTITAQTVTNNVALLQLNYDRALTNVAPAVSAFSVTVNSLAMNVQSVTISGTSVILTLAYEVLYGDVVTVAYTKPTSSPLQSATGLIVATMSSQIMELRPALLQLQYLEIRFC